MLQNMCKLCWKQMHLPIAQFFFVGFETLYRIHLFQTRKSLTIVIFQCIPTSFSVILSLQIPKSASNPKEYLCAMCDAIKKSDNHFQSHSSEKSRWKGDSWSFGKNERVTALNGNAQNSWNCLGDASKTVSITHCTLSL